MVGEEDRLIVRFNFTGTHQGNFLGFNGSAHKSIFSSFHRINLTKIIIIQTWLPITKSCADIIAIV